MTTARFVIGVDLGTTNCAVAYADLDERTAAGTPHVQVFHVPQVVAEGEVVARETLPSFAYLLPDRERGHQRYALPWQPAPAEVVGTWARDQGALVPGRLVCSAKSWLCNDAVDRRARILPWAGDGDAARSPVEASASYLAHVRAAWNHAMAGGTAGGLRSFERQAVVLTVPASFDEEARELTVEAAGLEQLTLIEEPTAALYAWIAAHRGRLSNLLREGDRLLICDVGGGTTDFTLVRVRAGADGEPHFERSAVGHHLLLGGDNLDLALVRHVEEKLGQPKLTLRQQQALRRQCAAAKERLLGPPPAESIAVSVLGAGASVVGNALSTVLSRDEVLSLLMDGFLPSCPPDAAPAAERRSGLRELGLPFASDPAITRHLAAFLREAGDGGAPARPDAVLFNGGFFTPDEARARVTDVLASWFAPPGSAWAPRVLTNTSPATAVAEGAACFGLARLGHGLRIGGGTPRTYYVALADEPTTAGCLPAVCVLPRGAEDGTQWRFDQRAFTVATNRPLSFTLLSSLTRRDAAGDVVDVEPRAVHRHAPLVTELRFGKRSQQAEVRVVPEVRTTEIGTLELWLLAPETGHRWRLQFQLRPAARREDEGAASTAGDQPEQLEAAATLVRAVFSAGDGHPAAAPDSLMAELENVIGFGKHAWPLATVRPLADVLLEHTEGRRRSPRHEARWLNLLGYCLRPGFGATLDEWRMTQARRLYLAGLAFPSDVQCHAEWLVLWQRLAGGLTPGQQQEVYQRHAALVGAGSTRRSHRTAPQIEREALRLLASLEHVPAQTRVALGEDLLARLRRDRRSATLLWAIARVGGRVPFHGPLNTVVPPVTAEAWADRLLDLVPMSDDLVAAIVQIAARTGDPARDLEEGFCQAVRARLVGAGIADAAVRRLVEVHSPSASETARAYGESLPEGLRLAR